jgi:hypothetical protein
MKKIYILSGILFFYWGAIVALPDINKIVLWVAWVPFMAMLLGIWYGRETMANRIRSGIKTWLTPK